MKKTLLLISLMAIVFAMLDLHSITVPTPPRLSAAEKDRAIDENIHFKLKTVESYRDYRCYIYQDEGNRANNFTERAFFEIRQNGCTVYRSAISAGFWLGARSDDDGVDPAIPLGRDITGDGQPDLIVTEWDGGQHGAHIFHIFTIGEQFYHIATINTGYYRDDLNFAHFTDLDGDGKLELVCYDWSFVYWHTDSWPAGAAPQVVLQFKDNHYQVAPQLMRRPPQSRRRLQKLAREIRQSYQWRDIRADGWQRSPMPLQLLQELFDIIYRGNSRQATELLQLAWPKDIPGKAEFQKEFQQQLSESPYWQQLER